MDCGLLQGGKNSKDAILREDVLLQRVPQLRAKKAEDADPFAPEYGSETWYQKSTALPPHVKAGRGGAGHVEAQPQRAPACAHQPPSQVRIGWAYAQRSIVYLPIPAVGLERNAPVSSRDCFFADRLPFAAMGCIAVMVLLCLSMLKSRLAAWWKAFCHPQTSWSKLSQSLKIELN